MSYDIRTLFQAWLDTPEIFDHGYERTYSDFLTYHDGAYNNSIDDGEDPDDDNNGVLDVDEFMQAMGMIKGVNMAPVRMRSLFLEAMNDTGR